MYRTTSYAIAQRLAATFLMSVDVQMAKNSDRWTFRTSRQGLDAMHGLIAEMWDGPTAETFRTA